MLTELLRAAPPALLVGATAVYAAALLWLLAWDVQRARWQREFGGWQALQRDRVARVAQPVAAILRLGALQRWRWQRENGCGWRSVQRDRIKRRRWERAAR